MPRMSLEIVDTKKQVEYYEKNLKDRTIGKKIWQTTKKVLYITRRTNKTRESSKETDKRMTKTIHRGRLQE